VFQITLCGPLTAQLFTCIPGTAEAWEAQYGALRVMSRSSIFPIPLELERRMCDGFPEALRFSMQWVRFRDAAGFGRNIYSRRCPSHRRSRANCASCTLYRLCAAEARDGLPAACLLLVRTIVMACCEILRAAGLPSQLCGMPAILNMALQHRTMDTFVEHVEELYNRAMRMAAHVCR
jgi:hypothetical protein